MGIIFYNFIENSTQQNYKKNWLMKLVHRLFAIFWVVNCINNYWYNKYQIGNKRKFRAYLFTLKCGNIAFSHRF